MREIEAKQWKLSMASSARDSDTCTYIYVTETVRTVNRERESKTNSVYQPQPKRFIIKLNFWQEILLYLFALLSFVFRCYFEAYTHLEWKDTTITITTTATTFFTFHSILLSAISEQIKYICMYINIRLRVLGWLFSQALFYHFFSVVYLFCISCALCVYWFTV